MHQNQGDLAKGGPFHPPAGRVQRGFAKIHGAKDLLIGFHRKAEGFIGKTDCYEISVYDLFSFKSNNK
jgi:hypothetical protein